MNLDNCPRCGKLFAKFIQDVCQACVKEIDQEYSLCAEYLRKNRGANIYELSEAVSVSIKQISKFIKDGRISLLEAHNLTYPCDMCGTHMRDGKVCNECRSRLNAEINKQHAASDRQETEFKSASAGYRMLNKRDK